MPQVLYRWQDNNGKTSDTRLNLRDDLDRDGAAAIALAGAQYMRAVSDAALIRVLVRWGERFDDIPGPQSDVTRLGLTLYRDDIGDLLSLVIPSIAVETELSGPLAQIRYTPDTVTAGQLISLNALVAGTVWFDAIPTLQFAIGGVI